MIVPKSKISDFLIIALPAFLIVGIQLVCYPILTIFYGHIGLTENILLIIIFLSIAIGEARIFDGTIVNRLDVFLGLTLIGLGIFFSKLILALIEYESLRLLFTVFFIIFQLTAGQYLFLGSYHKGKFHNNYIKINFIAFVIVVLWSFLLPYIGIGISFVFLGLILWCRRPYRNLIPRDFPEKSLLINSESLRSLMFGIISSAYLSCYFRILYMGLFPSGYEFNIYLFLSFFMLAISTSIYKNFLKFFFQHSTETWVCLGVILNSILLILLYGGWGRHEFIIEDLKFLYGIKPVNKFWLYPGFFCSLLFVPYLFFALIIPAREFENNKLNHLFFCSLGNVLGLIIFGLGFIDLDVRIKIIAFSLLACLLFLKRYGMRSTFSVIIVVVILMLLAVLPKNLEQRIIARGQKTYETTGLPNFSKKNYSVKNIKYLTKIKGNVGYLDKNYSNTRLGVGGYATIINNMNDLQKSQVVRDLISERTKRILILGLGNQTVLQQVLTKLNRLNIQDFQIDVVDNFFPFYMKGFRSALTKEIGFNPEHPKIHLHYSDAFQYLLRNQDAKYDLIAWNLNLPNYIPVAKLFTREASQLLSRNLKSDGYFVGLFFNNHLVDCSLVSSFRYVMSYPSSHHYPFGSLIASNSPIAGRLKASKANDDFLASCKATEKISLNNFFRIMNEDLLLTLRKGGSETFDMPKSLLETSEAARLVGAINAVDRPVVAVLPLTGEKRNLGEEILSAFEMWKKLNTNEKMYLAVTDSSSNDRLAIRFNTIIENQMIEQGTRQNLNLILLTPVIMDLQKFVKESYQLKSSHDSMANRSFSVFPVSLKEKKEAKISSMMPAMGNVFKIMKEIQGSIQDIYVLQNPEVLFSDNVISIFNDGFDKSVISGSMKKIPLQQFKISYRGQKFQTEDLLVMCVENIDELKKYDFIDKIKESQKLVIVTGLQEYPYNSNLSFPNTTFLFFWSPFINYGGTNIGSCEFSESFQKKFGRFPSYLSAYTYSLLEWFAGDTNRKDNLSELQILSTVAGPLEWNEKDLQLKVGPVFISHDQDGQPRTWLSPSVIGICDGLGQRPIQYYHL